MTKHAVDIGAIVRGAFAVASLAACERGTPTSSTPPSASSGGDCPPCDSAPATSGPAGLDRTGFVDGVRDLTALQAALGVDWISDTPLKLDSGDMCKTATDKARCRAKVDELRPTEMSAWGPSTNRNFRFLTTKGDDVRLATGEKEMLELFGAIESPAKLHYLANARGYHAGGNWLKTASR